MSVNQTAEEEAIQWIESQHREALEWSLRNPGMCMFKTKDGWGMPIDHLIVEYLEFLDRCDEEKALQEQKQTKARSYEKWGMFQ